jgi:hypothetical protein
MGLPCGWCGGPMLLAGPASLIAHGQSISMYYGNFPKKSPKRTASFVTPNTAIFSDSLKLNADKKFTSSARLRA